VIEKGAPEVVIGATSTGRAYAASLFEAAVIAGLAREQGLSAGAVGDGVLPSGGTRRWGQLRDSDPFVGSTTGRAQPNFAVAFELAIP
jgi:hypothetical protein